MNNWSNFFKNDINDKSSPLVRYRTILKQKGRTKHTTTNTNVTQSGRKKYRRVHFAPNYEQVYIIQSCYDICGDHNWLPTSNHYTRYEIDRESVKKSKRQTVYGYHTLNRWTYVNAYNKGQIQFLTNGYIDKDVLDLLLRGSENGYRSLERYSIDHQRRSDAQKRHRSATVQLYQALQKRSNTTESQKFHTTSSSNDMTLRIHCENFNEPYQRWAVYMGRLDRIVARRCQFMDDHDLTIQKHNSYIQKNQYCLSYYHHQSPDVQYGSPCMTTMKSLQNQYTYSPSIKSRRDDEDDDDDTTIDSNKINRTRFPILYRRKYDKS